MTFIRIAGRNEPRHRLILFIGAICV